MCAGACQVAPAHSTTGKRVRGGERAGDGLCRLERTAAWRRGEGGGGDKGSAEAFLSFVS